jgi:hypothetical protein
MSVAQAWPREGAKIRKRHGKLNILGPRKTITRTSVANACDSIKALSGVQVVRNYPYGAIANYIGQNLPAWIRQTVFVAQPVRHSRKGRKSDAQGVSRFAGGRGDGKFGRAWQRQIQIVEQNRSSRVLRLAKDELVTDGCGTGGSDKIRNRAHKSERGRIELVRHLKV